MFLSCKAEGSILIDLDGKEYIDCLGGYGVEFGIPMIAGLLKPILKKKVRTNSENMLKAIKEKIESGL